MTHLLLRRIPLQSCAGSAPLTRSRVRDGGGRATGLALREVWVARAHGAVVEFWGRRTEGAIMLVAGVDSSIHTQTPRIQWASERAVAVGRAC
jgi:hypothetical protein